MLDINEHHNCSPFEKNAKIEKQSKLRECEKELRPVGRIQRMERDTTSRKTKTYYLAIAPPRPVLLGVVSENPTKAAPSKMMHNATTRVRIKTTLTRRLWASSPV
jgi:hypothetical protein